MKCKICNQEVGWFYMLFNYGRCVHCKHTIERKLNPTQVSKEWIWYSKVSEKACDEYLK